MDLARLEAVHNARLDFAKRRIQPDSVGVYRDYRVVLHVHAEDAEHTRGTRQELLEGAKKAGVNVVMTTDHRGPKPDSWRGMHDGILFMAGAENDHELAFPETGPGGGAASPALKFLAHVEEQIDKSAAGYAGMEIYNRHADAVDEPEFYKWFAAAQKDPDQWQKIVTAQERFPDEAFAAQLDYWPQLIARWDKELERGPFTAISANDAHQNQLYGGVVFDPYEVSLRSVSTHVLARELTSSAIAESLREGRAYVAHDWLADPAGFVFAAGNTLGIYQIGDTIPPMGSTRIDARLPLPAHIKLFHKGKLVAEANDRQISYQAKDAGAYRVEAWLTVDGEERPWIYSNPIFLGKTNSLRLPSTKVPDSVESRKNIAYGPGDDGKQKLDVYLPKGAPVAPFGRPLLFFVHGGSWKSGDRNQYPALGSRFAEAGIVTVIPSYRLAPKHVHPAQIDDVREAFHWTVAHAKELGADPDRIYAGGHSAGGHLASLLGLTEPGIKGVISMSGVYDVDWETAIFQKDPLASPIRRVKPDAPPFVLTFCQWDYYGLPQQAAAFEAELRKAGVAVKTVYVPGKNHLSEVIDLVKDGDLTAQTVLDFVK